MRNKEVVGAAPYVAAQAMLTREDAVRGVLLRGVDPAEEPKVSDVGNQFRAGSMNALVPGGFGIALGNELANAMGVRVGDKVTLVAPQGTITPAGHPPPGVTENWRRPAGSLQSRQP